MKLANKPSLILRNKKAQFNYELQDSLEAGIVLKGEEVKAIRAGKVDFSGSYVTILGQEAYVINLHIGLEDEKESRKTRKLLLHKKEIHFLAQKRDSSNLTIIPVSLYNKGPHIKLEIALARGKKQKGKKETVKRRDIERDTERELKEFTRN